MRVRQNIPIPGSVEHTAIITASKIPAILGISPWKTPNELWQDMVQANTLLESREQIGDPADEWVDKFSWGHIAESALADYWRCDQDRQHGVFSIHSKKDSLWTISRGEVAYRDHSLPFPNVATVDRVATPKRKDTGVVTILECKTSGSPAMWSDGVPDHYFWQVLCQMGISGIHEACLIAQVGTTVPQIFPITWDDDAWAWLKDQIRVFWQHVEDKTPPEPIQEHYSQSTPDLEGAVEIPASIVEPYREAKAELDQAKAQLDEQKRMLTGFMLDMKAKDGTFHGAKITRRTAGRFSVKNLPEECKHLVKDARYMTAKFDPARLKADRPDIYQAATGAPSWSLT